MVGTEESSEPVVVLQLPVADISPRQFFGSVPPDAECLSGLSSVKLAQMCLMLATYCAGKMMVQQVNMKHSIPILFYVVVTLNSFTH